MILILLSLSLGCLSTSYSLRLMLRGRWSLLYRCCAVCVYEKSAVVAGCLKRIANQISNFKIIDRWLLKYYRGAMDIKLKWPEQNKLQESPLRKRCPENSWSLKKLLERAPQSPPESKSPIDSNLEQSLSEKSENIKSQLTS